MADDFETGGGEDETVRLTADVSGWERGLKQAGDAAAGFAAGAARQFESLGRSIGSRLSSAGGDLQRFGLVTAGVGAVKLGLAGRGVVESLGETARLQEIAQATGSSVEALSGLFGVMRVGGQSVKESIEAVSQFGTAVNNAVAGKGEEGAELFRILGRSAREFKTLDAAEGIFQMFDALTRVNDPLDKLRALSLAFGTDSAKLLLPMLNRSSAELRELARQYAMTAADAETARRATAAYSRATAAIGRAWDQVAVALAPAVTQLSDATTRIVRPVTEFVAANRVLVVGVAAGVAVLTAAGLAVVALGTTLSAAGTVLSATAAAAGLLASPLGLAAAAVAGLGAVLLTQTDQGRAFGAELTATFAGIRADAGTAVAGVTDALRTNDFGLAAEVAMAGLNVAWVRGVGQLRSSWADFCRWLADALAAGLAAVEDTLAGGSTWLAEEIARYGGADEDEVRGIDRAARGEQRARDRQRVEDQRQRDEARRAADELARRARESELAAAQARLQAAAGQAALSAEVRAATDAGFDAAVAVGRRPRNQGGPAPPSVYRLATAAVDGTREAAQLAARDAARGGPPGDAVKDAAAVAKENVAATKQVAAEIKKLGDRLDRLPWVGMV